MDFTVKLKSLKNWEENFYIPSILCMRVLLKLNIKS